MQVQDIINAVSLDMRQVLSNTAPDTNIIVPWVDRIHKDVLHTSMWNTLIRGLQTIAVTAGTSTYTLSSTTIRRITSVYDRTFDRIILPYENIAAPTSKGDATGQSQDSVPVPMLEASTMIQWPLYYFRVGETTLNLFPAPQKAAFDGTYEIYYENNVATLVNLTDVLVVPNDGEDVVVTGVNMLASQYLKDPEESQLWAAMYKEMKSGAFRG